MRGIEETPGELFFPPRCAVCARCGIHGICADCEKALLRRDDPLREGAGFGRCAVPLRYEDDVRRAILRLKFHGGLSAAEGFGQLLAQCAAEQLGGAFDCVSFVPVSARRRRKRGFDQAELIASEAAKLWEQKTETLLRKTRDNPPQSSLPEERRKANVLGVYEACSEVRGRRVLLIDDVITTGSTLAECVRVLKDAGAKDVVCAAVASSERKRNATA